MSVEDVSTSDSVNDSLEFELEGGGGVESEWATCPPLILSRVFEIACCGPRDPEMRAHVERSLPMRHRTVQGQLRLVNKWWCEVVDASVTVLRPDWTTVGVDQVRNAAQRRFRGLNGIVLLMFEGGMACRLGANRFGESFGGLPVKELDFSGLYRPVTRHLRREQWEWLSSLTQLETLNLDGCGGVLERGGMRCISSIPSLRKLTVSAGFKRVSSSDVQYITSLTNLTHLSMPYTVNLLDDLSALTCLPALRDLNVTGFCGSTPLGLNLINSMTGLTHLGAIFCGMKCPPPLVHNVSNLTRLKSLECDLDGRALFSEWGNTTWDLNSLTALGLTSLVLHWANFSCHSDRREKLDALCKLSGLKELCIDAERVPRSFWLGLAKVSSVTSLGLCRIRARDLYENFGVLGSLTNLRCLTMEISKECGTSVEWDPLTRLVHLTSLLLPRTKTSPTDLGVITKITKLEQVILTIDQSKLDDSVTIIARMTNLTSLDLRRLVARSPAEYEQLVEGVLDGLGALFDSRLEVLTLEILRLFRGMGRGALHKKYATRVLQKHPSLHVIL